MSELEMVCDELDVLAELILSRAELDAAAVRRTAEYRVGWRDATGHAAQVVRNKASAVRARPR